MWVCVADFSDTRLSLTGFCRFSAGDGQQIEEGAAVGGENTRATAEGGGDGSTPFNDEEDFSNIPILNQNDVVGDGQQVEVGAAVGEENTCATTEGDGQQIEEGAAVGGENTRATAEGGGDGSTPFNVWFLNFTFDVSYCRVTVNNASNKKATLIKVDSANKRGSVLEVVQVLTDLNVIIRRAYISSDWEWFMDVFHVTDQQGNKVSEDNIAECIQQWTTAMQTTS
ncbi:unnamed protein product [Fraxinus pennsylvanica]|uniref:ACT domain-containing protein ACR n=1 Tax=Fraxinus pennsylvanica TaxID=56036 RepID=A0AAD2EBI3_9LAMI|nr:unnamed protein product [Fraxinus pennsylvanica]